MYATLFSWTQVEHKLNTSWKQVEHKLDTSWTQVEHKSNTSSTFFSSKLDSLSPMFWLEENLILSNVLITGDSNFDEKNVEELVL